MTSPDKRDLNTSSDEMNGDEETAEELPTSPGDTAPATAGSAKVPFTGQDNTLPTSGDNKTPNIPGVEKIVMIDGVSGNDGVKIDTLDNATKDYTIPNLMKPGRESSFSYCTLIC